MKNIYIIVLSLITTNSFSQLELHKDGQPIGSTLTIDSASVAIDHFQQDLYIINTSAAPINVGFSRYRNYHTFGWTDQICDDLLCFNADDATNWERPTSPTLTVNPGDSSIMQLKVYPENIMGCAIYTYYVVDAAKVVQDSIQMTYTINGQSCFLGVEDDQPELEYTVYPNPASNVLNINISNVSNNDLFVVYNILGEEVSRINLVNGKNELSVTNLESGVYFYSVLRNANVIETKKIVIRH